MRESHIATVGCGMSESPNPRNSKDLSWIPLYGNSALSNNLWYGDKKTNDFCQGRFVFKLFDIFKTKNSVPQIIAEHWISVLQDSGRICGTPEIRWFRHPIAHCGIPALSFEVHRAPCPTPFQRRLPDPVKQQKFRTVMIPRYIYKTSLPSGRTILHNQVCHAWQRK